MDVFSTLKGQRFVWDSDKAKSNLMKHGVSFDQGMEAITDPFTVFEDASVPEERRESAIGSDVSKKVLYTVQVDWDERHIRLISARLASASERRQYEDF